MIQQAINQIKAFLPNTQNVTIEQIETEVDFVLQRPEYKDVDRDLLIRELKTQYTLVPEGYRIIELNDPERKKPWIKAKKKQKELWPFWTRYKKYLLYKKGFAPPVIDELDNLTDSILDGLYDPDLNVGFDKKGMVVGQVQSGKTSNYTGLICKAADAGYNLVIVLAGLHNNLRSQTQLRIDEGFLGFDTQFQRAFDSGQHLIGVGVSNTKLPAHSLTDSSEGGDFSKKTAAVSFATKDTIVAVVKKNSTVLKRLYQWLSNFGTETENGKIIHEKALLLIDDEADNASINTKKNPDERTAINGGIRDILSLFGKSGYVGYTATPFANIFIPSNEREDLFPRDFVINIPPPPNYIGPDKIFGFDFYEDDSEVPNNVLPICVRIDRTEEEKQEIRNFPSSGKKKDSPLSDHIPESLKTAIKCFILTCAIRKLRRQTTEHNSMLVHIARFKNWQSHVKILVEEVFLHYKRGVDYSEPDIIEELRNAFEVDSENYQSYVTLSGKMATSPIAELDPYISTHSWEDVKKHLYEAVINIKIREINGNSGEVLDYHDNRKNGLSVIAIGGDKLSRGLTLEGLSVSYYLRASKMYDTLMQMGRWFGYRHGYVDLCRLFTTGELNEWFCHITRATQELREEFEYMSTQANASPEKYALKVRTHPGVLQITASNKIRSAEHIDISWAGRLVESYELLKDYSVTKANIATLKDFIHEIYSEYRSINTTGNTKVWYDVPPELVIQFFEGFKVFENLKAYNPENQIRFIQQQIKNGELTHWRVALMSNSQAKEYYQIEDQKFGCFLRNESEDSVNNTSKYYIRKSHIIDKKHESVDLTEAEYQDALDRTKANWKKKGTPQAPSGDIIRQHIRSPQNPLLLLYLIDPDSTDASKDWDIPFVGYAISYPKSEYSAPVRYAISKTLLPYYNQESNTLDFDDDDE